MTSLRRTISPAIKLLHESEKHTITIIVVNEDTVTGELTNSEDSWNILIKDATIKTKSGYKYKCEKIFIRGSHVMILTLPDILKNSPMLKTLSHLNKV